MKTISVAVNDRLYRAAKAEAAKRGKTVGGLVSELLSDLGPRPHTNSEKHILALQKQHARGYAKHPVRTHEFDVPPSELVWGEA